MGDSIYETVVLLVAPDFADEKDCIEQDASDDSEKEDRSEKEFDLLAPVENDPADVKGDRRHHQADSQCNDEINCLLAADDAHGMIVATSVARGEGHRGRVTGHR